MVSTPKPPDPMQTATAQQGMNRNTAITQQLLNQTNQVTPYGNLTYSQSGSNFVADPQGSTYYRNAAGEYRTSRPTTMGAGTTTKQPIYRETNNGRRIVGYKDVTTGGGQQTAEGWEEVKGVYTPQFTATTTLTPEQLALKAQTDAASLNLGKLANQQSASLFGLLSKPFKYGKSELEDFTYNLGKKRLDPRFAAEQDQMRTQLINSGIRPGTPAYDQAVTQMTQGKNDAYNQLALGANDQAFNQALTQYNNPINVISGLMGGSQVQQPTFQSTPQSSVAGVDYTGLVKDNYNAKLQSSQAAMGGLFGLLSAPFSAMKFSDRRLKRDVVRIGTMGGLGRYLFRYVWDTDAAPIRYGVMADEVKKIMPWAVKRDASGFDMVDYGALA